ncbi:MAG: DUF2877 domain-containing protein [Rhodanobacteraceae bacterium]
MNGQALTIRAIGCKAQAALERSAGAFTPLHGFDDAPYVQAGGEIIWIGNSIAAMHPRAVLLERATRLAAGERLQATALTPWRPAPLPSGAVTAAALRARCVALHFNLPRVGEPRGFAVMLSGRAPDFPLDGAVILVQKLTNAFCRADADAACDAAIPLLGLGPGLTPSGDDLVGAALFARQAMAGSQADAVMWKNVAARVIGAAQTRSHAIGAALFRDLASGESFAPLHRLAASLRCAASDDLAIAATGDEQAIDAARALVAIGHSSGWDMLAGFVLGVTGSVTPPQRRETT